MEAPVATRKIPLERHPLLNVLACPETGQALRVDGDALATADGARRYPIVRDIPRFVASDLYVDSFSSEWSVHKHTQLDSYRHDTSSTDVFQQKTGLTPEQVRGEIAIWVYPNEGDYVKRNAWIPFTHRIPDRWFYGFSKVLVRWAVRAPKNPLIKWIRRVFPFSDQGLGTENDILDTFDGYSPRF